MHRLPIITLVAAGLVSGGAVLTAQGQQGGEYRIKDPARKWMEMTEKVIPASHILDADVTNGLNAVGKVSHVVLDRNGDRVEFLVIDARRVPWPHYMEDTYVPFEAADFLQGYGDLMMRIETTDEMPGPDEIDITMDEAEYRLVSRVTDSRLELPGEQFYEIEDLLVNRRTGRITHYVIGTAENEIFSMDRRAVPASEVTFRDGEFRSRLTYAEIESRQPYDPMLL